MPMSHVGCDRCELISHRYISYTRSLIYIRRIIPPVSLTGPRNKLTLVI